MTDLKIVSEEETRHQGERDRTKRGPYKKSVHTIEDKIAQKKKELREIEKLIQEKARGDIELDDIEEANRLANERDRKLELINEGFSVDNAKDIVRMEREEGKIVAEKRIVCGKARNCTIANGKIDRVYDSHTNTWKSISDFENIYGPKKDVKKEEKVEEKVEQKKEEVKKEIKVEIPKITVTTNMGTLGGTAGSSGTGTIFSEGANIVSVPKVEEKKVEKKVDEKRSKESRNKNMIDEYIDILYGGT